MIVIEYDGEPQRKERPRFNTKTGHAFTPRKTKDAEERIAQYARYQNAGVDLPLDGELSITLSFWTTHDGVSPIGRIDIDNATKNLRRGGENGKIDTHNRVSPAALEPRRGPAKHSEVFDMGHGTPYTPQEDQFICEHAGKMTHAEIANALGRSCNAVRNRCSFLGAIDRSSEWTPEEMDMVRERYLLSDNGRPLNLEQLAIELGRPKTSIARLARTMGLTDRRRRVMQERADKQRERVRQWHQTHAHPRGALGMVHTPEAREKMSKASRENQQRVSPEEWEERRMKSRKTIEQHYQDDPNFRQGGSESVKSRSSSRKREDLGGLFLRSIWEANYARYLNWIKDQGEIADWEYEADTFVFYGETRGAISYTPDFKVTEKDGSVVYHEVKGWMDGPSKTRLRRMKKHYPEVTVIVIGKDEYKAIQKWKGLLPNWETGTFEIKRHGKFS